MKRKADFFLISKPGAGVFFTWIALSAAIFFGAYSVRIFGMYQDTVGEVGDVKSRERELSYRLEMASAKINDSVETIKWSNLQIERLRKRNDDILKKTANLRKLLYAAIKKNQAVKAGGEAEMQEELSAVNPRSAINGSTEDKIDSPADILGEDILFPELSESDIAQGDIEKIVAQSTDLNNNSREVVAEVLTYNPSSKKVFINLGRSNAGISEGNRFAIWRDGKHVTDVRVAQVHAVTSTCDIISPVVDGISSGDTAELIKVSAY